MPPICLVLFTLDYFEKRWNACWPGVRALYCITGDVGFAVTSETSPFLTEVQ